MRRSLTLLAGPALALLAVVLPAAPAAAAEASAARTPHVSFALLTPNIAVVAQSGPMAQAGDRIEVTGAGRVRLADGTVHAGGTFVHRRGDGTLHCRGVWLANALTTWTDLGGRGRHAGIIAMRVTHYCATMNEVHADIPMTVTSTHGLPGSGYVEGVTVGEFTVPTAGSVLIRVGS